MMIAVTGPRHLTPSQLAQAEQELKALLTPGTHLQVGDAAGLDASALRLATGGVTLHQKKSTLPWSAQGAERSTRMVKALAQSSGSLHAWPNKPVPSGLKPSRTWPAGAEGSGTWGTVALAIGLGLKVELHPLADLGTLPEWLSQPAQQLSLL
jgi:hypothetical protein